MTDELLVILDNEVAGKLEKGRNGNLPGRLIDLIAERSSRCLELVEA